MKEKWTTKEKIKLLAEQKIDEAMFTKILESEDIFLLECLATNPTLSDWAIKKLVHHPHSWVGAAVAGRSDLKQEDRQTLIKAPDYWVRRAMASRLDLSKKEKEILSSDPVFEVREVLYRNLTDPFEIQEMALRLEDVI